MWSITVPLPPLGHLIFFSLTLFPPFFFFNILDPDCPVPGLNPESERNKPTPNSLIVLPCSCKFVEQVTSSKHTLSKPSVLFSARPLAFFLFLFPPQPQSSPPSKLPTVIDYGRPSMFAPSQQPPDRGQTAGVRNPFLPFGVANQTLVSLVSNVLNEVQPVSANWPEQDCIFADVGEYLVKCSEALAETAEKLVNHNHLMYQLHQSQQQQQWGRENFGYNSFYLPHKHESLK